MNLNDLPLVSIIIPVYNGSKYLAEAIDSALAQTYPNTEILVINDGSTDNGATREVARSYGNKISYFEKENGGVGTALNLGLKEMKGEYFSWLSHDDVYYPDKLSIQITKKSKLPENTILYSDFEFIDEKSRHLSFQIMNSDYLNNKPLYSILRSSIHGCSLLVPRFAFCDFGYFDENLKTTQDYDLWFKMRVKYKFTHQPCVLIKSRSHAEQGSKINPLFVEEGNQLWIKFIHQISLDEIKQCEKNDIIFYTKLWNFLKITSYAEAESYCYNLLKKSIIHRISQIFPR
jgi:glycosyltransferase involved in cell wall biosynthesis